MRHRQRRRWHRTAKPLERQLTIKQLGIGRGALEMGSSLGRPARRAGGPSGPIFALAQHLQRLPAAAVPVEERASPCHIVEPVIGNASAKPGYAGIFISNIIRLRGDARTDWKRVVDLPRDIVRGLKLPRLLGFAGFDQGHLVKAVEVGRPVEKLVRTGEQVARAFAIAIGAKVSGAVHHQAGVAGDRADDGAIARFCVGGAGLHRDARGESGLAQRAGQGDEARRVAGPFVEQQRIGAGVMIGGGEAGAIARPQRLLVSRGEVRGGPRLVRRIERFGASSTGRISLCQPRPATAAKRLGGGEEGDDRRGIIAAAQRGLGPAAHGCFVGPAGVGDEEAGVIGEAVATAGAQSAPVVQGIADIIRIGRGWRWIGRRILRRPGRGRGQDNRQQICNAPHAGHIGFPLLIRP